MKQSIAGAVFLVVWIGVMLLIGRMKGIEADLSTFDSQPDKPGYEDCDPRTGCW